MIMPINSNAQTNLGIVQRNSTNALEKLSSGKKINHAKDDPSGLLLATQMSFVVSGESRGTENINMAVDLLNTADSYTQAISGNMQRMSELASQASNALLTLEQRQSLQSEFSELNSEIDRLASNATYNGRTLLDGSLNGVTVQAGAAPSDTVTLTIGSLRTNAAGLNTSGLDISTVPGALAAVVQINNAAVNVLSPTVAGIGAQASAWLKSADAQNTYVANLQVAQSRIMDTDVGDAKTKQVQSLLQVKFGVAAAAQANKVSGVVLGLLG